MRAVLSGEGVRVFVHAVHCMARIGSQVFLAASNDSMRLRTLNDSRQAFAAVTLRPGAHSVADSRPTHASSPTWHNAARPTAWQPFSARTATTAVSSTASCPSRCAPLPARPSVAAISQSRCGFLRWPGRRACRARSSRCGRWRKCTLPSARRATTTCSNSACAAATVRPCGALVARGAVLPGHRDHAVAHPLPQASSRSTACSLRSQSLTRLLWTRTSAIASALLHSLQRGRAVTLAPLALPSQRDVEARAAKRGHRPPPRRRGCDPRSGGARASGAERAVRGCGRRRCRSGCRCHDVRDCCARRPLRSVHGKLGSADGAVCAGGEGALPRSAPPCAAPGSQLLWGACQAFLGFCRAKPVAVGTVALHFSGGGSPLLLMTDDPQKPFYARLVVSTSTLAAEAGTAAAGEAGSWADDAPPAEVAEAAAKRPRHAEDGGGAAAKRPVRAA